MTKKELVIEVATKLFSEKGYDNASISNICEAANVSKGLVYHHFKSKEDILKTIFSDATEKMKDLNEIPLGASPQENLTQLIEGIITQLVDEKLMFRLNLNIMFQPMTKAIINDQLKERSTMLFDYVKRIFDKISENHSEILSFMFIAEIDGIALHYLFVYEDYPINKIKQLLINKYETINH